MAGVLFDFSSFDSLLKLNIGIANRLDENRAESFTLLYCDMSEVYFDGIETTLLDTLRTSDSVVKYDTDYFFVLPYTDKYGAEVVKQMFEDLFEKNIKSFMVSYPVDGESSEELMETLQDSVSTFLKTDLEYLDRFIREYKQNKKEEEIVWDEV